MPNLRQELQPCFILHQRPFRETSLILDVFSENQGRFSIIAKGAKQSRSSFKSLLRPFVPLLLSWQGKSDLKILVDAQANGLPLWVEGMRLLTALYVNELLVRALHSHDAHKVLYQHYERVLNAIADLNSDPAKLQMGLRLFEFQLLAELGYAIDLSIDDDPKSVLRRAIQRVLGDKIIHSRTLVRQLLVGTKL
jgi:DNA repair protein RecO (recombination protein O)